MTNNETGQEWIEAQRLFYELGRVLTEIMQDHELRVERAEQIPLLQKQIAITKARRDALWRELCQQSNRRTR